MAPGLLEFSAEEICLEAYKANAEGKAVFMWVMVLISHNYTFNCLVIHNTKDDASLCWPLGSFLIECWK